MIRRFDPCRPSQRDPRDFIDVGVGKGKVTEDHTVVDATDLRCPLPVLRARKALKEVLPGRLLDVFATDEAAPADFEAFCRETGHILINIEKVGEVYQIRLKKVQR